MSAVSEGIFLARIPPWTAGCRVFTLPPSISGCPVSSDTSLADGERVRNTHKSSTKRVPGSVQYRLLVPLVKISWRGCMRACVCESCGILGGSPQRHTWQPGQHHAGYWPSLRRPPGTDPHWPADQRTPPVRFYRTRWGELRGKERDSVKNQNEIDVSRHGHVHLAKEHHDHLYITVNKVNIQ